MGVDDLKRLLRREFLVSGEEMARRKGVYMDKKVLDTIVNQMEEFLQSQSFTINSIMQKEGLNEYLMKKNVEEIFQAMADQAILEGRNEIRIGDFITALAKLEWHAWPWCSSSDKGISASP